MERLHCPISARSGHELAYSITSSARANSAGGTVIPGSLAVSALITNSNFVECTTARSADFTRLKDATGIDAHLMIRVHAISSAIHHIYSLT